MKTMYLNMILCLFVFCFTTVQAQENAKKKPKKDTLAKVTIKQIDLKEVLLLAPIKKELKPIGILEINQEQLQKEMTADVRDLVRYTPGVGLSYSSSRGGTRGFAIRGVEANRVAVTVDGVSQPEIHENMVFSAYGLSNATRIEFEPYFATAINIQKGASSFAVGSGALGGAVNYSTKEANDLISKDKNYGLRLQTSYSGKDNLKMYVLGAAAKYKKWEALMMFSNRYGNQINNFEYGELNRNVTSTRVDPLTYKQQALLTKLSFLPNKLHRFQLSYYMLNKKMDSEIWSQEPLDIFTSDGKPYYYANDQTLSHSFTLNYLYSPKSDWLNKIEVNSNLRNSFLDAQTWSEYYRPNFFGNGDYELIYEGRRDKYRGQEINDKNTKVNFDFKKIYTDYFGSHSFSLFTSVSDKFNNNRNVDVENPVASNIVDGYTVSMGERYEFGETMGKFINAYAFQKPINRINFNVGLMDNIKINNKINMKLGLRYDYFLTKDKDWNYDNDTYYIDYLLRNLQEINFSDQPISDIDTGLSYLVSINYSVFNFLNIGYKFSTGFRVPTTEEKYFQYYNSWPSFLVLSNRDLKPETSTNHEFEIAGNGRYGGFMVNFYKSNYKNFIDVERGIMEVTNTFDNTTKELSYVKNVNRHSAKLLGVDARFDLKLYEIAPVLQGFTTSFAASYAKGDTSYGTSMLAVQPLSGFLGIEYIPENQLWSINAKANYFMSKKPEETRFVENTASREIIRSFPSLFLNDAYTFDIYAHYQITSCLLIRAGVYNLFNLKYWRWDDLRQLTNPAMLPHIENFFREGTKTITRFSQPQRYISASLEFSI